MDDLISRKELKSIIHDKAFDVANTDSYYRALRWCISVIDKMPPAQPERKTGHWIHIRDEEDGNALYECSCCHKGEIHVPIVEVSYCWNCGADMRGEPNE